MCLSFTSLLNCLQSVQGEGVVVVVALVFPLNPHPTASIDRSFCRQFWPRLSPRTLQAKQPLVKGFAISVSQNIYLLPMRDINNLID